MKLIIQKINMKNDKNTQIIALAVIIKNDKVLLTQRNQPSNMKYHRKWNLPGGSVEYGEHPEESVIREAQEELGISITIVKLIPHIYHYTDKRHMVFISYLCITKNESIMLNEESLAYKWVEKSKIEDLNDVLDPINKLLSFI